MRERTQLEPVRRVAAIVEDHHRERGGVNPENLDAPQTLDGWLGFRWTFIVAAANRISASTAEDTPRFQTIFGSRKGERQGKAPPPWLGPSFMESSASLT
jgi:hypothetical protein